ncbi:hypothetical protein LCGC14_2752990, partial [marine sediment metagenome]
GAYDRHISVIKGILEHDTNNRDYFSRSSGDETREYDEEFDYKHFERELKTIETKLVKLNQAIQLSNYGATITFKGEEMSLAEALELRKKYLHDLPGLKERVTRAAFKTTVHKEVRDIVQRPKHSFKDTYKEYLEQLEGLRTLKGLIHSANHATTVKFKDET